MFMVGTNILKSAIIIIVLSNLSSDEGSIIPWVPKMCVLCFM